ncbi:MAG: LytR/AlgR family response regulator transcription factor, partial [Bdellovibrionota bacterium]
MKTIRALLVDDEKPARARLARLLQIYPEIQIAGEATNGMEALERIDELKPDLIFLDIEMPELDGFGVARAVGATGPAIVFVTAFDEFALKAFETHAIDYLVKPVAIERLAAAIAKYRARVATPDLSALLAAVSLEKPSARLAIRSGSRFVVVDTARACAIVAKDHYAAILVDGRELLSDDPLDVLEKKLDPAKFLRVHRSAIVNIDFIQELER